MILEPSLLNAAYLVAAVLFILSLRGLSSQETAGSGNVMGMLGMFIAVGATLCNSSISSYGIIIGAVALGGAIGIFLAARVAMTAMPELVALLHSFVGLAAVLVGIAAHLNHHGGGSVESVEIFIDIAIGAITLTGSIIAFFKLKGSLSGNPMLLPGRHFLNLIALTATITLGVLFAQAETTAEGTTYLLIMIAITGLLGMHLVLAIGGADMPVVVSMLNSYSGWTASAAGFMLGNDLLIITGALVGSSGAILSYIMCKAMNRSIVSVIFGGFGAKPKKKAASTGDVVEQDVVEVDLEGTVEALLNAKSVVVVPGYGMAVARAQHAVREMTELLEKRKTTVRFAIHPVAGRLPGHMNVLLAEAKVPYPIVLEMDEINDDLPETDVVLVIGANDIVNPSAQTDESSPIWGMPVLEVWKSKMVVVMKRSRAVGYAGIDNPLFYHDATQMLFGDALESMTEIVSGLRNEAKNN